MTDYKTLYDARHSSCNKVGASIKEINERIETLVGTPPEALDTIEEIADRISQNDSIVFTIDTVLKNKVSRADFIEALSGKQDILESGTNVKTLAGQSLLEGGDLVQTIECPEGYLLFPDLSEGTTAIIAAKDGDGLAILVKQDTIRLYNLHASSSDLYVDGNDAYVKIGNNEEYDIFFTTGISTQVSASNSVEGTRTDAVTFYSKPEGGIPLSDLSGDLSGSLEPELYWVTKGTTTLSDIQDAVNNNKFVVLLSNGALYTIGDLQANSCYFYRVNNDILYYELLSGTTWTSGQNPIELQSNKVSTFSGYETSTSTYLTTKATYDEIKDVAHIDAQSASLSPLQLENTSNKVTSISSSSTDTQYPSAKAVYSLFMDLQNQINNLHN